MTEPKKTVKIGRPTVYQEEFAERAEAFLAKGKSITQLARYLNVAKSTIYEWDKSNEAFSVALSTGKDFSQAVWEDKLEEMMYDKEVNSPLVKLYFANRFKWHDKPAEEEKNQTPQAITINLVDAKKPE